MNKKRGDRMKHIRYLFVILSVFILTSCFVKNNKPRAEIPIGIFESESFSSNGKNYLYGRIEIKEITDEEYENANGTNVCIEDGTNKHIYLNLGFYNGETNEFEYYDIKDLKMPTNHNNINRYRGELYAKYDSEKKVGLFSIIGRDNSCSIHMNIGDLNFSNLFIPVEEIKYNDSIPLGKFRSNDFEEDYRYPNRWYSHCIIEIKEISEEEYNKANGINAVADISGRQGIRKYCFIFVSFYEIEQEKWIECDLKDCNYYICNGKYIGLLYEKGTTIIKERFEMNITKGESYDFTLLLGIDAYFTRIKKNE